MADLSSQLLPAGALTFDDVLLVPGYSDILPAQTSLQTRLARDIELNIPLVSAAMDTVTEQRLAIAMSQAGGIGIIHRNLAPEEQAEHVSQVKKFESGMVINPVVIGPDATLQDVWNLKERFRISGFPVVENGGTGERISGKLLGILTNRDMRFAKDPHMKVSELMTRDNLVTVADGISQKEAQSLFHDKKIEKLLVVDDRGYCIGLITVSDMEKAQLNPNASKDDKGRLRVGAAISVGEDALHRARLLIAAEVDVLVVDTAHGASQKVLQTVDSLRQTWPQQTIIAGNVATGEAVEALINVGADAVKVGIGPGSICTTRIVAGVGVPQLSAIMDAVKMARKKDIPIIADGGIRYSGDLAKALAAGASSAMIGSLLAGTEESPGEVYLHQGRSYKAYRGMGSVGAMARGSADRYFQAEVRDSLKLVPEGIEGQVPYKGGVAAVLHQLTGGVRAAMGYVGARDIPQLHEKARFNRITNAGYRESHSHDVQITRESPNYPTHR